MDILPRDILIDIFLRLPIRSLCLSRCACKKFCTIISDPTFSITQIERASNKTVPDFIVHYDYYLKPKQLNFVENNEQPNNQIDPIVRPKRIDIPFIHRSKMHGLIVMGSYNGLLCLSTLDCPDQYTCSILSTIPSNPIYVFNPITGEHLQLPHFIYPECMKMKGFMCGFGFDVSAQEYKLVLVLFYKYDVRSDCIENEVQVYTLGNNSWRRMIGVVPDVLLDAYLVLSYVFVNGALHWITLRDSDSPNCELLIVSFHLGVEEFSVFPTPKVDYEAGYALEHIELGVMEDHLALVDPTGDFIRIWYMENDNGKKSWIKQFVIQKDLIGQWHIGSIVPIKLRKNGELVLQGDSCCMISYNSNSRKCRSFKFDGVCKSGLNSFEVVPLVGSLISIKSVCGIGMDSGTGKSFRRHAEVKDDCKKFTCCLQ